MKDTNKVIQGLWIGGELSTMEQLSIQSFLQNGHEYHLYTYEPVKNIPKGTIVKDGREILSSDRIFTYQSGFGKGSYAGFADLFRFHLLHKKGGWWTDTDVICLKPFDFEAESVIASSYEGEWGNCANICVLKLVHNSELTTELVARCESLDPTQVGYGDTGSILLQRLLPELSNPQNIAAPETFCPISWRAVNKIVRHDPALTPQTFVQAVKDQIRPIVRPYTHPGRVTHKSYALHLWNEIWRQNQIDKNATYSPNCWYERLKRRYSISPA
ncbi:hypothetical protein LEP3755_44330 [Leptolyngbya sp. NIES-3755]|nr:hypothetical protein LEP3755_44330 [Leptolyngbya sp. NIES-3755]